MKVKFYDGYNYQPYFYCETITYFYSQCLCFLRLQFVFVFLNRFASLAAKYKSMYSELLKNTEDRSGKVRRIYEILLEYADINN